ncbi:hypothetical protein ACOME3_009534 [Neoechinorhynchus agilis]
MLVRFSDLSNLSKTAELTGFENSSICCNAQYPHLGIYLNLRDKLDPAVLINSSNILNLEMMKWQMEPKMDLNLISSKKCVLFGSGTLGCNIARILMGWSVQHITFVDQASSVSVSAPVRQSLFAFDDAKCNNQLSKCECAAAACRKINPQISVNAVKLHIPCPGSLHCNENKQVNQLNQLIDLIDSHDVVFLVTDTRESRLIPTLIARAKDKIAITVAVGFDSALVIRHGRLNDNLGCYFCTDNSTPNAKFGQDRTLDMQCTVSRPGISMIVSGFAVEMLVNYCMKESLAPSFTSCIPHSIRVFLSNFHIITPEIHAFDLCIACGPKVREQFKIDPYKFLITILNEPNMLPVISGLNDHVKGIVIDNEDDDIVVVL